MDKLSFTNSQLLISSPSSDLPHLLPQVRLIPILILPKKPAVFSKLDSKPPASLNVLISSSSTSQELPPPKILSSNSARSCTASISAAGFDSMGGFTSSSPDPASSKSELAKPGLISYKQQKLAVLPFIKELAMKGWNPLRDIIAAALDIVVEKGLIHELEKMQPLPDTANPQVQLAGNFFPVPEHAVQHELEIEEGNLPKDLEGVYVRNGANPRYRPTAGHHLFDGDGMLHAVKLKQGMASYANRFTRTHRFLEEERVGRPMFPKAIGELHGHSGIARLVLFYARAGLGLVEGKRGMGVANAGVVYFNGRLLAMSEDDLPYAVRITSSGDLQTLGRFDFDGQLQSSMIAHPKVDSQTGQLFALTYDVLRKPYLKYFKVSRDGKKESEVSIEGVHEPTMMHDFAITKHFVVIPDQQVIFKLQEMLRGGSPVVHCKEKTSRFGLLPRDAVNDHEMTWIDVPDCFCFHLWNAWEEEDDDEVVVIGSCMTPPDSIFNESNDSLRSVLSEIRLNRKTLTSHRRVISDSLNLEAGQVNHKLLGRKTKFVYLAIAQPWPKVCGIAKVNLHPPNPHPNTPQCDLTNMIISDGTTHDSTSRIHTNFHSNDEDHMCIKSNPATENVVASFMFPPNCFGGEPMFVPRSHDSSNPEDDGYVLTFMHNEATGRSNLLILDASSPSLEMLASIKIPSRVPYGFHGTFITSEELEHQKHCLDLI